MRIHPGWRQRARPVAVGLVIAGSTAFPASLLASSPVYNFATPSKNIVCTAALAGSTRGSVMCIVLSTAGGKYGYPKAWYLPVRGAASAFRQDNSPDLHDAYRHVLPYGTSWHRGYLTCASRSTGLTCVSTYTPTRHGFFVSRESQRVW
jgi:hypothetical protein